MQAHTPRLTAVTRPLRCRGVRPKTMLSELRAQLSRRTTGGIGAKPCQKAPAHGLEIPFCR
jgi:hypothetical protein